MHAQYILGMFFILETIYNKHIKRMDLFENIVDELNTEGFKVTLEWMATKYDEMNKKLFGGQLPKCEFEIYTTGKGSQGRSLGHFYFKNRSMNIDRYNRRLYIYDVINGSKHYIDTDNMEYAKPTIGLNGNTSRTEKSALSTLVHEMCHFYNHRRGYMPKQAHGPEFQNIARIVTQRAGDIIFPIQTYASAEEREEFEWSEEIRAKKDKRLVNKLARRKIVLVYKSSGDVRLINANGDSLVKTIVDIEKRATTDACKKVVSTTNEELKQKLDSLGYRAGMVSYRFWNIKKDPIAMQAINNCKDFSVLYKQEGADDDEVITPEIYPTQTQTPDPNLIKNFSFKLTNGKGFSAQNITVDQLRQRLHTEFPNWSDEAIEKIINNKSYAVRESVETMFKTFISEKLAEIDELLNEDKKKKDKKVYNDKGEEVPETCTCGGKIGLYIQGEPVYLCSKCKKYYGTMPFNPDKIK